MDWPEADALWVYTVLPEPHLSTELERLSFAKSVDDTDVVTFQPCPNHDDRSQDRFVVQNWALPNGTWSFRAVFDGHAGHETADYACENLPEFLKCELTAVLEKDPTPTSQVISDVLTAAILSFDDGIGQALLDIFPSPGAVKAMSDEEIRKIVNDDGPNSKVVLRCMRGTTVLVALVDPTNTNIWVASLGDCAATLGTKDKMGQWTAQVLSSAHNGENEIEAHRVRREHPGEPECILYDRVLGTIAVTRALGDFSFKLPAPYVERVFMNQTTPGFAMPEKIRAFIHRILTPPYMTGVPDVKHVNLASLESTASFLILNSDGLTDLSDDRLKLEEVLAKQWVNSVVMGYSGENQNLALKLLREALGGSDADKVSRMITVEMTSRWMDDTTILVVRL